MALSCLSKRPTGARLPLREDKKNFSTSPSENPAPPDFRLPRRRCAISATMAQRPPAIFNTAGNSTNPFDVLCCTRLLSVQVRQRHFSPCSNGRQDHGLFERKPQRQGRGNRIYNVEGNTPTLSRRRHLDKNILYYGQLSARLRY